MNCPHLFHLSFFPQSYQGNETVLEYIFGEESLFSKGSTAGQPYPLQSKRDGDEKEDGADGARLVDDQEVGGVEEQQEQMAGHQRC